MILAAMAAPGNQPTVYSLTNMQGAYADVDFGAATYVVQIRFAPDGTVDVLRNIAADLLNEETHTTPGDDSDNTYVRCTNVGGSDMTSGQARGVWLAIDQNRDFIMSYAAAGGPDTIQGDFDFELSSDASGSPIEASKLSVNVSVGSI